MSSEKEEITLFLAGDVMTGRGIDQILPYSVGARLYETYVKDARTYVRLAEEKSGKIADEVSYDYVWGKALQKLNKVRPDVRIINLETAVTDYPEPLRNKAIHYRMHPENVKVLTAAGLDICSLANNHILDWNRQGLRQTLRVLERANVLTTGAGEDVETAKEPAIRQISTGRVLVFAYAALSSGMSSSWAADENRAGVNILMKLNAETAEYVIEHISAYRKESDYVILSIHWGSNWGYDVPRQQQKFARRLVDSGAVDIVFGHSSHHPKGIEIYKGHPIFYGCGDLINDYEGIGSKPDYRDDLRLLYFPRLNSSGELVSLKLVPVESYRFQLRTPSNEDRKWLINKVRQESLELATDLSDYLE